MTATEMTQRPVWRQIGPYAVSSELFMDVIFTEACNCSCPYCIARTQGHAVPDRVRWEAALEDAFRLFPIRSLILLGGEATVDPQFREKLERLSEYARRYPLEQMILTTNGIRLAEPEFLEIILDSPITAVNLSRMHHDQAVNDAAFGRQTPTRAQIREIRERLRARGKTLRLNANVWRGNLDTPEELEEFVREFSGCCDAVKFSPLMDTEMFGTVPSVREFTKRHAIADEEIRQLYDRFAGRHSVLRVNGNVLGFVQYAELSVDGQRVILKYAQVEDKYDRDRVIPTLKLYPNGCLSNEWSYQKDIRAAL